MKMKKILVALFAGVIGTAVLGVSAMAAGDSNAENGVAKLGNDYYSTVKFAIADANAGDTVYVLADPGAFTIDKAVTVKGVDDADGKVGLVDYQFITIAEGIDGKVVIDNLAFNGTTNHIIVFGGSDYADLDLTINDCYIEYNGNRGIYVDKELKSLTVSGCTIDNKATSYVGSYSIWTNTTAPATMNITGNEIKGAGALRGAIHVGDYATNGSEITISENKISGVERGVQIANQSDNVDIVIEDNTFTNIKLCEGSSKTAEECAVVFIHENATTNLDITVKDNTATDSTAIIYNENAATTEKFIADFTSNTLNNEFVDVTGSVYVPVAEVDGTYYATIKEALNAAVALGSKTNPVTINLSAGEIGEAITLPSYIDNVTFKGADNYATILKNSSVGHSGGMSAAMTNVTFDGIVFENSAINLTAIYENTKIENMKINDCKFLNITGKTAVSINTNSLPNLNGFTFTNNVIDNVSGGNFSGLVLRAAPAGDIVISGNTISNVAWNAIQLVNLAADANVTITGNTMSSGAAEGVLNLYGAKCGFTLADNIIETYEGQSAIASFDNILMNGKYYASLDAAIAAARDNDTITLLGDASLASANIKQNITIDLADNTLTVDAVGIVDHAGGNTAAIQAWKNVTITNGIINATSAETIVNGIFYVGNREDASLTISDVTINAANTNGTDLFVVCNPGTLNIVNSVINAKKVNKVINGGDGGSVAITGSEFNVSDSERVLLNLVLDVDNSEFVVTNLNDNAFRNISGTITDTKIDANGYENGIKNDNGAVLTIDGNSLITLTGAKNGGYDLSLANGADVVVEDTAKLEVVTSNIAEGSETTGNVVSKAETVYIQYKKTDLDDEGVDNNEEADVYDIVLAGYASETINELASADITFKFTGTPVPGAKMDYDIVGAKGVTVTQLGDSDRFMFNYNGIDKYEETGKAIIIGTITVSGYGTYYLGTDATVDTNAVYATEIRDSIVDGFKAAGELVVNEDMVKNDGMVGEIEGTEITVPTRELKINIDFPNGAATNNAVAYQQMTVKVTGGDLEEALVIKLGDIAEYTDLAKFAAKTSVNKAVSAVASADAYDITITDLLTLSIAYNVEVSGAGYRTARYTVTMTDDKELFFWNNVKDNETVVEEGKKTAKVTFLAGDIVKDNDINIYDLSAVVSYFGEEGLDASNHPEYAKYDLNRDGKIDSKDVAYVLVSWNN